MKNSNERENRVKQYIADGRRTIAIDFDDTITERIEGASHNDIKEIRPWAKKWIPILKNMGFRIVIWTARIHDRWENDQERERSFVRNILNNNNIPFDEIQGKPFFAWYIGDEAFTFKPENIESVLKIIINDYNKVQKKEIELCPICSKEFDVTDEKKECYICEDVICENCLDKWGRTDKYLCQECFRELEEDILHKFLIEFI